MQDPEEYYEDLITEGYSHSTARKMVYEALDFEINLKNLEEDKNRCFDCGALIKKGDKVPDDGEGNCPAGGTHHYLQTK